MRRPHSLLWLVSPLLYASWASAEPPPQRELLLFEEPPVSAAAKHPQPARDAPSWVAIITQEDIRRFGFRTLAEALRSLAGFYTSYDRNYDYLGVRGFLRPNDSNDRILLLVNGHTYNNDIYGQAYIGQDFGIDLEAIDHIEVIRGPGSALYGGNAFFAVINVVTLTAAELPGVHALAETGSFWRKRGQATAGQVTDQGLDVFASGSVFDVDGPEELSYPQLGVARNADGERALHFFSSAQQGGLSFQGSTSWREKQIPTGAFGTTFGDPGTMTADARDFAEVRYGTTLPADVGVMARLFYDRMGYHGTYVYGSGPTRVKNQDLASSNWLGGEVTGRRELFAGNALTVGTEYTYHPHVVQQNFDLPSGPTFLDDVRSYATIGVYGQEEWTVLPTLTLVGGLRYDSYYNRIHQVSPRVAAIWRPRDETTVKLLFGQAFRPPDLFEQYYAYPAGGVRALPNPGLKPEQITTYEAALEQELWGRAVGSLAAYHNEIDDLIDQVRVGGGGAGSTTTLQYRNVGSAEANGAEAEVRVPLPHAILARSAYSLQEARDAQGRLLSNSPKHLGNARVLFPLAYGVNGGTEFLIIGPRRTRDGRHVETAPILNLSLTYTTPIPNLGFTAGFYNLLDRTYPDPAGPQLRQDRIAQDGLTFRVQVLYAF